MEAATGGESVNVLDLFSGIGGFSLGLERAGFKTVAFCEIDPFCRQVLKKHWPDVPIYEDVRNVSKARLDADGIGRVDVVTGGFPCQDISIAGNQAGIGEGARSGLWSELARIIGDLRPEYAIVENVTALLSGERGGWFGRILGDLAEIGYDAEWHCIPASSLGAIHDRDRVWIIAYPNKERSGDGLNLVRRDEILYGRKRFAEEAESEWSRVLGGIRESFSARNWDVLKARVRGMDVKVPPKMDRLACGGLGNSVTPIIPEIIGRAIMKVESNYFLPEISQPTLPANIG